MNRSPLDGIRIARPCPASWADMSGNERVRFCALCTKNVYNLSAMSRGEAEDLLRRKEGGVCVRLFRRTDGTVVTGDCPGAFGARAWFEKFALIAAAVSAIFWLGGTILGAFHARTRPKPVDPPGRFLTGKAVLGEVCPPPPPAP